jgi:hypothetical protein
LGAGHLQLAHASLIIRSIEPFNRDRPWHVLALKRACQPQPFGRHFALRHARLLIRSYFRPPNAYRQLRYDEDDPVTALFVMNLFVMKIVEHANAGELDPDRLCSRVLREIATQT